MRHGVDVTNYLLAQGFDGYLGMLNGSTYENLVKDFWVRAKLLKPLAIVLTMLAFIFQISGPSIYS